MIVVGFARPEVQSLTVTGPRGEAFDVEIGERWTPASADALATKPFMAVGKAGGVDAVGDPRGYSIEVRMEDGRTERAVGP
jgi:hypothetical protein